MKLNRFLLIFTLTLGCFVYGNAICDVVTPAPSALLKPSQEQQQVAKQLSFLVDRTHYLQQPIDEAVSGRVLQMMIDDLDSSHTLFLASDVDELKSVMAVFLRKICYGVI